MTEQETEPCSPSEAAGSSLGAAAARAAAACRWCASAGAAGYALHGPALAVAMAAAGAAAGAVAIVMLAVVTCRKDQRSPFERLMLIICLLVGRRPADYLPLPEGLRLPGGPPPACTRAGTGPRPHPNRSGRCR